MEKKSVINVVETTAPVDKVWDALVNPEKTKIYMYGCETVSDWNQGSALLWRGSWEGKEMVFVKGSILEIQPPHKLKYTVLDPNGTIADIPENYLQVSYSLEENSGITRLTVIQDGFENAAEGEKRYKEVYNNGLGWDPILQEIKKLVENQN